MPKRAPKIEAVVKITLVRRSGRYDATITAQAGQFPTWSKGTWSRNGSLEAVLEAVGELEDRVARPKRGRSPRGWESLNYFNPSKPPRWSVKRV